MDKDINKELASLGIKQISIPPYHLQAERVNNPTERVNKGLEPIIRIFLADDHRLWDHPIEEFTFAMNNAQHDSIHNTPYLLNFGRNPHPGDLTRTLLETTAKIIKTSPSDQADSGS